MPHRKGRQTAPRRPQPSNHRHSDRRTTRPNSLANHRPNNPRKIVGIEGYGLKVVERVPIEVPPRAANVRYLRTKKAKLGHILHKV